MSTAWVPDGAIRAALAIGLALLVDALIGDPVFTWHPVRLLGRLADAMEDLSRLLFGRPVQADSESGLDCPPPVGAGVEPRAVAAGALAWALTFGLPTGLVLALSSLAGMIHPVLRLAFDTAIVWASIAPGDLSTHALRVKRALERDQLTLADANRESGADPVSILACLAAPAVGGSTCGAFAAFLQYRQSHASPNAGHPEAAYAGAFGLRLGGPILYPEGRAEKPWMNPAGRDAGIVDIRRVVTLMNIQTLVSALAFLACRFALDLLLNSIQVGT